MKTKNMIAESVYLKRINRKLKRRGVQVRTARDAQTEASVGRHYIVDTELGVIAYPRLNLPEFAHLMDVVRTGERQPEGWEDWFPRLDTPADPREGPMLELAFSCS